MFTPPSAALRLRSCFRSLLLSVGCRDRTPSKGGEWLARLGRCDNALCRPPCLSVVLD
nr:MAG TPA: hypothetical protein [Caudoviricetes sp.]